ncbi:MAG: hypothetical protein J2P31_13275 [Blastocatellia bacterium]|nr:hypothetical protein [Blastocatellia bacterium]
MNLKEAMNKELKRGKRIIYAARPSECHVCHKTAECRAGACFDCKDLIETDMINVWEIANPANQWPYVWIDTAPEDVSEEDLIDINRFLEDMGL